MHLCPTNFRFRDGMLENRSGRVLVRYFGSSLSVVSWRSVETIGDGCFGEHGMLVSLVRIGLGVGADWRMGVCVRQSPGWDCSSAECSSALTSMLLPLHLPHFDGIRIRIALVGDQRLRVCVRRIDGHCRSRSRSGDRKTDFLSVSLTPFGDVRREVQLARGWAFGIYGLSLRVGTRDSSPVRGKMSENQKVNECNGLTVFDRMPSNSRCHRNIDGRMKYLGSVGNGETADPLPNADDAIH
jgi:hypothetical protein